MYLLCFMIFLPSLFSFIFNFFFWGGRPAARLAWNSQKFSYPILPRIGLYQFIDF